MLPDCTSVIRNAWHPTLLVSWPAGIWRSGWSWAGFFCLFHNHPKVHQLEVNLDRSANMIPIFIFTSWWFHGCLSIGWVLRGVGKIRTPPKKAKMDQSNVYAQTTMVSWNSIHGRYAWCFLLLMEFNGGIYTEICDALWPCGSSMSTTVLFFSIGVVWCLAWRTTCECPWGQSVCC